MYVIVGLGNPGKKYDATRHNVGFETIDMLARRNNIEVKKLKHKALCGEGIIGNKKVMLVKPQTFMNLSGQSLLDIVQFYKIDPKNLIVIYDDIDIPPGAIRIRKKGSAGTHNGMRSIIYMLQTDQFPRIRVGVGKPEHGDLVNHVIGKFSKEEIPTMIDAIERSSEAVEMMVTDGIDLAMNRYNG